MQAGIHKNFATTKFVSGRDFLDSGFRRNDGLVGTSLYLFRGYLGIVAKMCDKVAVMYAGKIVEQGDVREIYNNPKHPYTQALIKSIPRLGNKDPLYVIPGQPPNLADLPTGCAFHPRCPYATEQCINEEPPYVSFMNGQQSKCWLSVEDAKNA